MAKAKVDTGLKAQRPEPLKRKKFEYVNEKIDYTNVKGKVDTHGALPAPAKKPQEKPKKEDKTEKHRREDRALALLHRQEELQAQEQREKQRQILHPNQQPKETRSPKKRKRKKVEKVEEKEKVDEDVEAEDDDDDDDDEDEETTVKLPYPQNTKNPFKRMANLQAKLKHSWRKGERLENWRYKIRLAMAIYHPLGEPSKPEEESKPIPTPFPNDEFARRLKFAKEIKIYRYPEPFNEITYSMQILEPKNYKVVVGSEVLYYSYDYTPFVPFIRRYKNVFCQVVLDPTDQIVTYFECKKRIDLTSICWRILDLHKPYIHKENDIFRMRAENGDLWGRIVAEKSMYTINDHKDEVLLQIKKDSCCKTDKYTVIAGDELTLIGSIEQMARTYYQVEPNHNDYVISFNKTVNDFRVKLLLVGFIFFLDYRLDSSYSPFLRYGSDEGAGWVEG